MKSKRRLKAVLLCFVFALQLVFVCGCDWLTEVIENSSESVVEESIEAEGSSENSIEKDEDSEDEDSSLEESSEASSEELPCTHEEVGGIVVTAQPTKTTYAVGDSFDPSGMVVKTCCKACGKGLDAVETYDVEYPSGKTAFRISDTYVTIVYGQYRVAVGISVGTYTPGVPI